MELTRASPEVALYVSGVNSNPQKNAKGGRSMKKLFLTIAVATVMFGLTLGNAYAQAATPTVKGMKYGTYIKAGGDQSFATIAFSAATPILSIAGYNGFGLYLTAGPAFVGLFYGIDVKFPGFVGNAVILFLGSVVTANTIAGYGYVFEEHVGDYYYKNFPFVFTGAF